MKKRLLILLLITLILTTSTALAHYTEANPGYTNSRYNHSFPKSELFIGGIGAFSKLSYVTSIYGKPQKKDFDTASDGRHFVTYYYGNLTVSAFNFGQSWAESDLEVYLIYITDGSLTTPSGIAVGQPYSNVTNKYGYGGTARLPRAPIPNCTYYIYSINEYDIVFAVDYNNIIKGITIQGDYC